MAKLNEEKLRALILKLLDIPIPLTSSELRSRLLSHSVRLPEYEITQALRPLQADGLVRYEKARWRLTSKTEHETPATKPPITNIHNKPSPPPSSIFTKPLEISPEPQIPASSTNIEYSGPWGTFRKLLNYYSDCIRNDGGYEASAFLSDYGKKFIFTGHAGPWFPTPGRDWHHSVPNSPSTQGFIRELGKQSSKSTVLLLGYPLWVFSQSEESGTDGVFVKPVFTYQLEFRVQPDKSGGLIEITCPDPFPNVNLDWLQYALKKPEDQRSFLSGCGLMNRWSDEISTEGVATSFDPDLQSLANAFPTYFPDKIKETLRPSLPATLPFTGRPATGFYNRALLMIGNRQKYTQSLLNELDRILSCDDSTLDQTALQFIFKRENNGVKKDISTSEQIMTHEGIVADTCDMNAEQREAVAAMLTEDITVVTGPPGTGKSQVVTGAMTNARLKEQSVLFTSRNHKAIDAIESRLISEDGNPLLIRANSKEDAFLKFGFEEAIEQLLTANYEDLSEKWALKIMEIDTLLSKRGQVGIQADKVHVLRDKIGDLEANLSRLSELWKFDKTARLTQNTDKFPSNLVRAIGKRDLFKRQVSNQTWIYRLITRIEWFFLSSNVKNLNQILNDNFPEWNLKLSNDREECIKAVRDGLPALHDASEYCINLNKLVPLIKQVKELPEFTELTSQIKLLSANIKTLATELLNIDTIRRSALPRDANREMLASLRSAIKNSRKHISDESEKQSARQTLEETVPQLLEHYPLWAVTNLSIASRIPFKAALFDLAIIDEASQCDIPSAIPILFRAKRVAVVGDPKQLSHTTRLKGDREALIRKRHGLIKLDEQRFSYSETSLFKLFSETNNVHPIMLSDHYRCHEEIIGYCNQGFYGNRLRIATAAERLNIPKGVQPGIHWTEVSSEIMSSGPSGCIAPDETNAIIKILQDHYLKIDFEGTLGIVTPFAQQSSRIRDAIIQSFPSDFRERLKIIVDTAHGFQGDERDVMIMSLCGGPDMPQGSKHFLRNTANLVNVAVSRARAVLHVVGNRQWAEHSGIPHLEKLSRPPKPFSTERKGFESPWERILYEALEQDGLKTEPQYPVLGRRLDLALVSTDGTLKMDIEVDGDRYHRNPDGSRKRDDIWRNIQLQGAGWKVLRFWVYQLREDLPGCVSKIRKEWEKYV